MPRPPATAATPRPSAAMGRARCSPWRCATPKAPGAIPIRASRRRTSRFRPDPGRNDDRAGLAGNGSFAPVPIPRARAAFAVDRPLLWVLLLYACGIGIRAIYTFHAHPPENFIGSDMYFYVTLAKRLASTAGP